jgi:nitrite reductase/ring-hydroxylating ferredoxin subunit/metal-sulfur cluster biosynthetic enzyme
VSETFVTVAKVGEIPEGGVKVVRLDDRSVAVFHLDGGYHALEDLCTHDGGPLAEGTLEGCVIECPRHGARFDVKTGAVLSLPATAPVPRFDVRVVGDDIQVSAREARAASPAVATVQGAASIAPSAGGPPAPAAPPPAAGAPVPGATAVPTQQELAVRSALETVMDPEIGLSVIDLGLIKTVEIRPDRTRIEMLLTTPFCPYAPQMMADVKAATQSVLPQECDVEILPDAWSPDMMPDPSLLGFSY